MKQGLHLGNVLMDIHTEMIWFIRNILLISINVPAARTKALHGVHPLALEWYVMDIINLCIK